MLLSFVVFDREIVDGLGFSKYDSFFGSKISRTRISSWEKHTRMCYRGNDSGQMFYEELNSRQPVNTVNRKPKELLDSGLYSAEFI